MDVGVVDCVYILFEKKAINTITGELFTDMAGSNHRIYIFSWIGGVQ